MTTEQLKIERELHRIIHHLAGEIGERNTFHPDAFQAAEIWLGRELGAMGYAVRRHGFRAAGIECANLDVEIRGSGKPDEIVVVGAHYDSVIGSPGANDNGTGIAAVLILASQFAQVRPVRTLRFVLFANEEPPHFLTADMGSLHYASACKTRNENIIAMITPETIGCYSDEPGSQRYPIPMANLVYPTVGNFIAFVGLDDSRALVSRCVGVFRARCAFPCEGAAVPSAIPMAAASDHWSFWKQGYPALMVTDTAPFRYPHYHRSTDTPDKVDYPRTARVISGLGEVVQDLAAG